MEASDAKSEFEMLEKIRHKVAHSNLFTKEGSAIKRISYHGR